MPTIVTMYLSYYSNRATNNNGRLGYQIVRIRNNCNCIILRKTSALVCRPFVPTLDNHLPFTAGIRTLTTNQLMYHGLTSKRTPTLDERRIRSYLASAKLWSSGRSFAS